MTDHKKRDEDAKAFAIQWFGDRELHDPACANGAQDGFEAGWDQGHAARDRDLLKCGANCQTYMGYAEAAQEQIDALKRDLEVAVGALRMFDNRRKLAHSLRAESPQVAAFVEAIGVEIDKIQGGE